MPSAFVLAALSIHDLGRLRGIRKVRGEICDKRVPKAGFLFGIIDPLQEPPPINRNCGK
jgi:hypothetical protein